MTAQQHRWVAEDLLYLVNYAELHGLPAIRDQCQLAYEAAVGETIGGTSESKNLREKLHFVDAIRGLIEYADSCNLAKTRDLLIIALMSSAEHLDAHSLGNIVVKFPRRSE